ncbi:hypothetical protein D7030_07220 [Flavobacteriaceae bacterium AU392]|nr:hypothetical protein D1817_01200 [Flavobacteriaceae bacterium]RKM84916.1 hypothetical protein D7030_07220 [Flavobacteriaceae bacterium AU392]
MTDKKNIDRLFQEGFKDFEAHPNKAVWDNIANELHPKKKRRRVLPIWLRVAGVAASLVLLITAGRFIFNNDPNSNLENNPLVNTNSEENNPLESNSKSTENNNSPDALPINNKNDNKVTTTLKTSKEEVSKAINNFSIAKNSVSNSKISESQIYTLDSLNKVKQLVTNSASTIFLDSSLVIPFNENKVAIHNNDILKEKNANTFQEAKESEKLSLIDEITIAKNIKESLEKESENITNIDKWSIKPNIAPVYFNTLGSSGSSIGSQFNDNSKTSDINFSYGISARYAVGKRLSVRTGINKVSLGFSTNDVLSFNTPTTSSATNFLSSRTTNISFLRNVDLNSASQNTSVVDANDIRAFISPNGLLQNNTSIDQKFGFIEVPLEIEYAVLDKKFGVSFIGGFSALFLNENEVFSTINGQNTLIGEATNINSTSYSANFGLGVNYKFSKSFNFNIEPTFKYQLNTFTNTTGDFQPYFIGLYSGFIFNF